MKLRYLYLAIGVLCNASLVRQLNYKRKVPEGL